MSEFRQGWAVVVRDFTPVDGDDADTVTVLKVYWGEDDARAEVRRLRGADQEENRLYYCESTDVEAE